MTKYFILSAVVLLAIAGILYGVFYERQRGARVRETSGIGTVVPCDGTLWRYNAEKENVITPCITITGVVQSMHAEADGDENIQVRPDAAYVGLRNVWNIVGQHGNIAAEAICENIPSGKEKDFMRACTGYHSAVTLPRVGDHISVTGSFGTDQHRWVEIHPVTNIAVIP